VRAILRKGLKVFIVRVDDSCHTCTRGNFLGESVDQVDQAGFIKLKLNMNCLPPPHEPLFQDNFERNAVELVQLIHAAFPAGAAAPARPSRRPSHRSLRPSRRPPRRQFCYRCR
jgi:hypothetical protein